MRPGSVCRHLKIAGRVIISRFFHVTSQQFHTFSPWSVTQVTAMGVSSVTLSGDVNDVYNWCRLSSEPHQYRG